MKLLKAVILFLFLSTLSVDVLSADDTKHLFRLPSIFSDNMVLQANKDIPVWGWAEPGTEAKVDFKNKTFSAVADKEGKWRLVIKPLPAGGPFEMKIISSGRTIIIKNILIGEVWLCSGQSNMQLALRKSENGKAEAKAANDSMVRCFFVERCPAIEKKNDCRGKWLELSPKSAGNVSAVAYYFAKQLRSELKLPVGLILSYWGGTSVECWISMEGFEESKVLQTQIPAIAAKIKNALSMPREGRLDDLTWMKKEYDDSGWKKVNLPCLWYKIFKPTVYDGVIWVRKKVTLPEEWKGKKLILSHNVDDFETTYVGGVEVGKTLTPSRVIRKYIVPESLTGEKVITVAVKTTKLGQGGFCGRKEDMNLSLESAPDQKITLAGEWKYKASLIRNKKILYVTQTSLYNGMIEPFITYALAGVVWYQGENNSYVSTAVRYRKTFPALIRDWRKKWQQGDFPFYYVQLPNYKTSKIFSWPLLRESQLKTLAVPNTGMAVTIDIGDPDNIHPANKKDVGYRLSLWALAKTYGKDCEYSGPLYKEMLASGNEVILSFTNTTSGLLAKGGELAGFEIAGTDKKYFPAEAVIKEDKVIVKSDKVKIPIAVRYAWKDNPEGCNLYNGAGLPASPFRTE